MPPIFPCDNPTCKHYTTRPGLCEDCKEAARKLDRKMREDASLERQQYVNKNEGLRRHKNKWGGR